MASTKSRGGRPQAVYHPKSGGDPVVGLMRLADGRWRVSGPEKFTFTEPDEGKAVARCLEYQLERSGKAPQHFVRVGESRDPDAVKRMIRPPELTVTIPSDRKAPQVVERAYDEQAMINWFTEQLATRPGWLAQRTGVEWLAWGPKLKKPAPSPKLDEVGELYRTHAKITEQERAASMVWWKEFSKAVGVSTLRELDTTSVKRFRDEVSSSGLGPTAIGHKFGKVKAIINFARKEGLDSADCRNALEACAILVKPQREADDPHPISREDFRKMFDKATELKKDKVVALLLCGLNFAMYAAELSVLKWKEIQGDVMTTTRNKSAHVSKQKVRRAAVLWPETIAALKKIRPAHVDAEATVFRLSGDMMREHFERIRFAAHVSPEVKFSHLRDGAYTAAVEGDGVEFQHCQVLAGHRCGMADKYVARRPRMVEKACEAVRLAYLG